MTGTVGNATLLCMCWWGHWSPYPSELLLWSLAESTPSPSAGEGSFAPRQERLHFSLSENENDAIGHIPSSLWLPGSLELIWCQLCQSQRLLCSHIWSYFFSLGHPVLISISAVPNLNVWVLFPITLLQSSQYLPGSSKWLKWVV